MKSIVVICICFVLFCSCQQNRTKENQKLLIGDWYPVIENVGDIENIIGYKFSADGLCENKAGFYNYFYRKGLTFNWQNIFDPIDSAWFCDSREYSNDFSLYIDYLFNINRSYGNKTTYHIDNETLNIFDLSRGKWMQYHLDFEGKDTLKLSYWNEDWGLDIEERYVRKVYEEVDETPLFEQIVYYKPGSCYTDNKLFLIRHDGLFFSYGYYETGQFFIAKISKEDFKRIETLFKVADIETILTGSQSVMPERHRQPSWGTPSISFVTKDKKIKTINDPFMIRPAFPMEFYWAYLSFVFFHEQIELKAYHKDDYPAFILDFDDFMNLELNDGNKTFLLSWTERFYIGALLCDAEKIHTIDFDPKRTIFDYRDGRMQIGADGRRTFDFRDKRRLIETDGRYFKYTDKEGEVITLDIGFNFLKTNDWE